MPSQYRRYALAAAFAINILLLTNVSGAMYLVDLGVYLPPSVTTVDPANPNPDDYRIRYVNPEFLPNLRFRYRDPIFNLPNQNYAERIMRLTDGGSIDITTVMHEYSSITPFNETTTKIVVMHHTPLAVYDLRTYQYRPVGALGHALPRWSRTDENILYYWPYVDGGEVRLYQYDTSTGTSSGVGGPWSFNGHTYDRTFNNAGEDDLCFGGDHLVRLAGWNGRQYMVVFSLSAKAVVAEYDLTGAGVDGVEIAPAFDWLDRANDKKDTLIVGFVLNEERPPDPFGEFGKGLWAFQFDGDAAPANRITPYQQVNTSNGHHDIGQDSDGSPIMAITNSANYNPLPGCQTGGHGIEKIPLANPDSVNRTTSTCLLGNVPWSLAEHISLPDQAGWAFVSFYDPADPIPGETGWKIFTNELAQLKLDGSGHLRRLAHHRSRPSTDGYIWQPRLSASRDGKTLAFTSNFGYGVRPNLYTDVYLMDNVDAGDGVAHALSVSKIGNGSGVVVSRPSGLYCGSKCSAEFSATTRVTLSATPAPNSTFAGWKGACDGTGPCTVQMSRDQSVIAMFKGKKK